MLFTTVWIQSMNVFIFLRIVASSWFGNNDIIIVTHICLNSSFESALISKDKKLRLRIMHKRQTHYCTNQVFWNKCWMKVYNVLIGDFENI
jgi:hypothetical protein